MRLASAAIACVVTLGLWSGAEAATAEPCEDHGQIGVQVDRLLDSGELDLADHYLDVQESDEDLSLCATEQRTRVEEQRVRAKQLVTQARTAAKSGDEATASTMYLRALALDVGNSDAREELDTLLSPSADAEDPFSAALELHRAGFEDEAQAEVAKQITENGARVGDLPPELEEDEDWVNQLIGGIPESLRVPFRTSNLPITIGVIGALLISVLIGARWTTRSLTPTRPAREAPSPSRFRRWLARTWPFRPMVRPVLKFEFDESATDVKACAALRDAVTAALLRDAPGEHLDRAGPGDLRDALSALDVGVPGVGKVAQLVSKLLVQRVITVSITLEPMRSKHVGATVIVTDWRGHTFDATRVYGSAVGDGGAADAAEGYMRLSPQLTGWLAFVLVRIWRAGPDTRAIGETTDSASYSHFLTGYEMHRAGDPESARVHYYSALSRDPTNRLAMMNIGAIDARSDDRLNNALAMLELVRPSLVPEQGSEFVLWAQSTYMIAVTKLHRDATQNDVDDARALATELYRELDDGVTTHENLFCLNNRPVALSLLNSTWIKLNRPPNRPIVTNPASTDDEDWAAYMTARAGEPSATTDSRWRKALGDAMTSYGTDYNVACAYARCAAVEAMGSNVRDGLRGMAFKHLRRAVRAHPPLTRWARSDRAFLAVKVNARDDFDACFKEPASSQRATHEWTVVTHDVVP